MFLYSGIADLFIDIHMANYGMSFIRIGNTFDKSDEMIPYIERAKKYNMKVC